MIYKPEDNKIDGWMSNAELKWLNDMAQKMDSIVEIGSYKGRSTHALASGCKGTVYAVDHFVGSADPVETGNKDTYEDFKKNIGGMKNVQVVKWDSLTAAKLLTEKYDMVFIDGGHQYHEVVADIRTWLPKAKKILCGHDICSGPVLKAVRDTLGSHYFTDTEKRYGGIWWVNLEEARIKEKFLIPQESHPERKFVLDNMKLDKNTKVLDLGCGEHKTIPEAIGIDIMPVTDIRADISELPLSIDNESVDYIISRHSFEHLLDPISTLKEWSRVLKTGGKIIIILPDHEKIDTMQHILSQGVHLHAYTKDSFSSLVDSLTLIPLKIEKICTVVEDWSFGVILKKY